MAIDRRGKGPGRVIRALRVDRGLGVRELAARAKVPAGYISELETGKKVNPGLGVLQRLARALGVPVGELLE
jgi:transcriptional regulator with XRE-family HTH domain